MTRSSHGQDKPKIIMQPPTPAQRKRVQSILGHFIPEYADGINGCSYRFNWKGKAYYRIAGVKKLKTELKRVIPKNCTAYTAIDNLFSDWYSGETVLSYANELFGDVLVGFEAFNMYRKDVMRLWKPGGRERYFGRLQAAFSREVKALTGWK